MLFHFISLICNLFIFSISNFSYQALGCRRFKDSISTRRTNTHTYKQYYIRVLAVGTVAFRYGFISMYICVWLCVRACSGAC